MKQYKFLGLLTLAFIIQAAYGQTEPMWTQVPVTFYNYSTNQQPAQSGSGPFYLYYPGPPPSSASDALGCQWNQFSGNPTGNSVSGAPNGTPPNYPFWWQGSNPLSGTIPRGGSSAVGVVFEDPVEVGTAMKGVSFLGSFSTAADSEGSPIQSVFWESDSCADGDTEYGFFYDLTVNATKFYYSYWTNCPAPGDPSGYYCTDSTTGEQVTPCVGGLTFPDVPASSNGQYYYNAFPYQDSGGTWWFRAEILDGESTHPLFACDVNPASQDGTFNCFDTNGSPASAAATMNNQTIVAGGSTAACSVPPPFNANTYFNPGWTSGVYGSLFAVVAGGVNDNNPVTNLPPFTVSAIKAGK